VSEREFTAGRTSMRSCCQPSVAVTWRVDHSSALDFESIACAGFGTRRRMRDLGEALNGLAQMDPRRAQVIELRFFGDSGRSMASNYSIGYRW
jgi:hypothetical protein